MKDVTLNFPTFGFVVATRVMLGVGIGLLVADRVPADRRRQVALSLLGIGAASTIPAVIAGVRGRTAAPTEAVAA
jgi:hypothetical protein